MIVQQVLSNSATLHGQRAKSTKQWNVPAQSHGCGDR